MKHGGAPDALSHHNGPAEHGLATMEEDRAVQKVFATDNSMPIGMSAIGVSLLSLAAMLGVRMRRGLQQVTAFASSGGHESDKSIALAPTDAGNILELKTQESNFRGQLGWSQQSSKSLQPLAVPAPPHTSVALYAGFAALQRKAKEAEQKKYLESLDPSDPVRVALADGAHGGAGRERKGFGSVRERLKRKARGSLGVVAEYNKRVPAALKAVGVQEYEIP